ncbi:unnamed protein product [Rotaria sp. Silwood2]|nr:unnamed protein product [Rotaria sp. Silwood2]CAF4013024.1 unnamed protein product [Rotaria sp. Silwood2]
MQNNLEQFVLVCLDSSSNHLVDHLKQFQRLISCVQHFNDANSCIDYITNIKNEKILLIISVEHFQMIPSIYHIQQIYSIYIFNFNQYEQANKDTLNFRKVRGHFETIDKLVRQITYDKKYIASNLLTINSFPTCSTLESYDISNQMSNNNIQEATFMYSQILRNIFINEIYKDIDKNEMIEFFRQQYNENETELEKIDKFEREYTIERAIYCEFLSTSKKRELAEIYIQRGFDDMQSILFEIELNYTIPTSTPFADISEQSQFDLEEEILLSMGSVFRIQSLTLTSDNNWNIKLIQTSDEDQQLKLLYEWLNQALFQVKNLYTKLSSLMLFIYDYDKAEFFLRITMSLPGFNQDIDTMSATSSIFGEIYFHQKKYEKAILLYQKTIELFKQHPDKSVPSTIQKCYTGLSEIYLEEEQYIKGMNETKPLG